MLEGGKPIEVKDCKRIRKILLVEDNEINLEIMQSQLLFLGYQVDTAINGKEALIKYQIKTYDIILTDLEMPEMDGYALAAEIRRIEENSKEPIPILAVTASDFDLTKERAISMGFNGYMLKPFEIDVLEKKLASIVYDTSKAN